MDNNDLVNGGRLNYAISKFLDLLSEKASANDVEYLYDEIVKKANATGVTTQGTGSAYTADVPAIVELVPGASFTMVPHTASTSQTATLNVSNLGARMLRRPLSANNVSTVAPTATNWLTADKPVRVMYNGTYWLVMDMARPNAPDIYGTVAIANGGTGHSSITDTAYTTARYRASALVSAETDPTTNGVINWLYE